MTEIDTAPAGMTVRDLYELIIRVISFGYIVTFVIVMPSAILDMVVLARQAQDVPLDQLIYGGLVGSLLSQIFYIVMAVVLFLLAKKIAPLLERDPQRLAPVINQWSPVFVVEIVLLTVGILYLVSSLSHFVPWLVRPNPPEILESERTEALISTGIIGLFGFALIFFRLPLARFVTGSLRFTPATKDQSDAPPSAGQ
ncbi:MAG: hypothetical protein EA380_07170 [Phycisphaeraceae bacterium]|nr:MAG: hypothetical protein EA380_07170 [Phycisphaeraceae bacterium]